MRYHPRARLIYVGFALLMAAVDAAIAYHAGWFGGPPMR